MDEWLFCLSELALFFELHAIRPKAIITVEIPVMLVMLVNYIVETKVYF